MKVNSEFPSVIAFRRALHYALTNEFEYDIEKSDLTRLTTCCGDKKCKRRIHAFLTQDGVTFENFVETHSCTRSNKCGNKHDTQGWIADLVTDKTANDFSLFSVGNFRPPLLHMKPLATVAPSLPFSSNSAAGNIFKATSSSTKQNQHEGLLDAETCNCDCFHLPFVTRNSDRFHQIHLQILTPTGTYARMLFTFPATRISPDSFFWRQEFHQICLIGGVVEEGE
ncbi:unnamed protein product [Lactuca virosa]|uniref:Transposase MuDR plant domain-containing protein n=1 Tax=Lactuca virosa TaxID=75947 RepID=A0AAU9MUR8_9ASTR|nr:unnamed protein product [Lactuca virosa]